MHPEHDLDCEGVHHVDGSVTECTCDDDSISVLCERLSNEYKSYGKKCVEEYKAEIAEKIPEMIVMIRGNYLGVSNRNIIKLDIDFAVKMAFKKVLGIEVRDDCDKTGD